ncbi:MAG: glycosyltransferase [Acidimicrobiales bacterium]
MTEPVGMADGGGSVGYGAPRDGSAGYRVQVPGMGISADAAEPADHRPRVVIVTDAWASNGGEHAAATRFLAGAMALRARVIIVSIEDRSKLRSRPPRLRYDGVFPVHSVAAPPDSTDLWDGAAGDRASGAPGSAGGGWGAGAGAGIAATSLRASLVRAALSRQPGGLLPEVAARGLLERAALVSEEAVAATMDQHPDVVVLAGPATFWMGEALPLGPTRPRVVLLPLCGDDPVLSSQAFRPIAERCDAIGVLSEVELHRVAAVLRADRSPDLRHIRLALPVNQLAAASAMAGVSTFGAYVLVISAFGDDPASWRCPQHDYLRHFFGDVAIAEVRRHGWLVTGAGRRFDMTWTPTRVNLWRLMARASVTVDMRPPGPVGRETIESLLFGTPVVVPDSSVAAEHAANSNGGLWARNQGEMADCVRRLLDDDSLRSQLGANGARWARDNHSDTDAFVSEVIHLVLGAQLEAGGWGGAGVSGGSGGAATRTA